MQLVRAVLTIWASCFWSLCGAGTYDWVIRKLPQNLERVDKATYALGTIGNEKYLAIQLNIGDETNAGFKPALVFAKINKDKAYEPFEVMELSTLASGITVQIKNESIYLRIDTARHGIFFRTYQFKLQEGRFRLVGIDAQSSTSLVHGESSFDLWEGWSANLLTSEVIHWAQAAQFEPSIKHSKFDRFDKSFNEGLRPTNVQTRSVKLRIRDRWYLDRFDPYYFDADFVCHYFELSTKHRNPSLNFVNGCK